VEAEAPAAESLDTIDAQASGEPAGDSKGRGPKAEGRKSKKK
jgi:hypothetical protein